MASVGQIIHDHRAAIIRQWNLQAEQAASARGLSAPEFTNVLPRYLDSLSADGTEAGPAFEERRGRLERHLAARLRQGFDAAEVAHELVLLGQCIADVWASAPPEERPDALEIARLQQSLQLDIAAVTHIFTDHLMQDEQAEKRYHRQISQLVREGLAHREQLESRLQQAMAVVAEATNASLAALLLLDPGSRVLNTRACAGLAQDALRDFTVPVDAGTFLARAAFAEEPTEERDAQHPERPVDAPLRDEGVRALVGLRLPLHGPLGGVLVLGFDEARALTQRELRRAEAMADHLAHQVDAVQLYSALEETIAELHEERAARERFVSLVVHDLRGPLASTLLSVQLIGRTRDAASHVGELARHAEDGLQRMDRMIRDLLDANRIRAGEPLPLQIARLDLTAMARTVLDELRLLHGNRFHLEAAGAVEGMWSADELRRTLWNLAVNAVKYGAPATPITIRVRDLGERAELSVHNRGPAISPAMRRRLFQPFARTMTEAAEGGGSWGLGLTLVAGVAAAHGGRVRLESTDAEGTTFTLELPKEARVQAAAAPAAGG